MDEKIVQALSARSASLGCAQELDNHQWPLSLLWKETDLKMPDLENQLDGRSSLIMMHVGKQLSNNSFFGVGNHC
eukprot:10682231-Karenia_brevis.AAC.1